MSQIDNDTIQEAKKNGGSETQQIISELIVAKAFGNEDIAAELEQRFLKKN